MQRRLCLLDEIPKGDSEIELSLVSVKARLLDLTNIGSTKVDSLVGGTVSYSRFTEFRTIISSCYNTHHMVDIFNEIKRLYPTEYSTTGIIVPATIKAYLTGLTAITVGGPGRGELPISVGSIPPIDEEWAFPTRHIILYNNSTLEQLYDKSNSTSAYIYTEIKKSNPTLADFDGFDNSDITSLKAMGITTVELWGYKDGTIYTKLFEGSVDDLKIKSNIESVVIIGAAAVIVILVVLLLVTSRDRDKKNN